MIFFSGLDVTIHGFTIQDENHYEFPGIKAAYDLAQSADNYTAIAYLHTKGISYFKGRRRDKNEEILMETTFSQWRKVLRYFEEVESICKAGALPAKESGFIYYNFWWARPSYLRRLETPIISDNRFYYEGWLGRHCEATNQQGKTISIADWNERLYTQPEAVKMLRVLRVRCRWKFILRRVLSGFT